MSTVNAPLPTEVAYADAQDWWVQAGPRSATVRDYLYSYRGVLGSLRDADDVASFLATDGYDVFACTVRLVSITESRFIFTAHKRAEHASAGRGDVATCACGRTFATYRGLSAHVARA